MKHFIRDAQPSLATVLAYRLFGKPCGSDLFVLGFILCHHVIDMRFALVVSLDKFTTNHQHIYPI